MARVLQSSTVVDGEIQADGRFWAVEAHVMDDGTTQQYRYLADPDCDIEAVMAARAAAINGAADGG